MSFTIGILLRNTKKQPKITLLQKSQAGFFVCFDFVLSWGFHKWAIKRYIQLIERKK